MKFNSTVYAVILSAGLFTQFNSLADNLDKALINETRTTDNIKRDNYRHPKQTLEFFEVKPNQTVVEIWPGAGWYSEILAPYLQAEGKYYAAHFPLDTKVSYFQKSREQYQQRLKSNTAYSDVIITEFNPLTHTDIAPANSADTVLTFRNLHNWYMNGGEDAAISAFKSFYKALKPGGILGVVDHQMPENLDQNANKNSGYVKMSQAISWALQAGFELEASSEINANPKDSAEHPKGVWTLPPSLRLGEENKHKYLAIGESDRFTLKFRKPK
ncbi:methyltransferase [Catenovulum sp. 2E275]|uniref:class I SAM-dependent methyltransferase n=1 Tax=Catenovulum sp. 2E275 TaxID=2980497 RepID=UPI0021D3DF76|nr:methyltransferase [Catenovulum sp. 2E275]MCU4677179.1 methyltransferase [Catenovulum sp. 2E275]